MGGEAEVPWNNLEQVAQAKYLPDWRYCTDNTLFKNNDRVDKDSCRFFEKAK